jgi:hypothetical protein
MAESMRTSSPFAIGLLGCLVVSSCAAPLIRVAQPDLKAGPPIVERLVDLGGRALPDAGPLSRDDSDGVLTPGEWVAVLGQQLDAGAATQVTVDGKAIAVKGHLQGGSLLVQVPRHLGARKTHLLAVTTPSGASSISFNVKSYVVVSDTDGKIVHFLPIDAKAKTVLSKSALDLDVKAASLHVLAPSGAWLYVVQSLGQQTQENSTVSEIVLVHVGARGGPRQVGTFPIRSAAAPTSVTMLDDSTLVLLTESELLVYDVRGAKVAPVARVELPRGKEKLLYTDVEAFAARPAVAVLEAFANVVLLVDLSDVRAPRLLGSVSTSEAKGVPWSIDLVPDPIDGNSVWLLQGPNLRMSGEKVSRYVDAVVAGLKAKLGMGKPTNAAEPPPPPSAAPEKESHGRLVQLRTDGSSLQLAAERALPSDFYPFFLSRQSSGEWLVSGVSSNVFRFAGLPRSLDGLKSAVDVLTGSIQFGRILRLRDGSAAEAVVKGAALYFNMDTLADGTLLYSVIRPGFSVLPPSLNVEWGVESAGSLDSDQDYRSLVELEWEAIIPPYTFGMLSVQ